MDASGIFVQCQLLLTTAEKKSLQKQHMESYKCCLKCCSEISATLHKELTNGVGVIDGKLRVDLANLLKTASEKAVSALTKWTDESNKRTSYKAASRTSSSSSSVFSSSPVQSPILSPRPPFGSQTSQTNPLQREKDQWQILEQQKQQCQSLRDPTRRANKILEISRKQQDLVAAGKRRLSMIQDRHSKMKERLQFLASQRTIKFQERNSSQAAEENSVLQNILAYDKQAREEVQNLSYCDQQTIETLCRSVLSHKPHPITEFLTSKCKEFTDKVDQATLPYAEILEKYVAVPYILDNDEVEPKDAEPSPYSIDFFNDLFENDDSSPSSITSTNSNPCTSLPAARQKLDELQVLTTSSGLIELKRFGMDELPQYILRVRRLFILAYHESDDEQSDNISEDASAFIDDVVLEKLFELVGSQLRLLLRIFNVAEERRLAQFMTDAMDKGARNFEVNEKLLFSGDGGYLHPLISRLQAVSELSSPLDKLRLIDQVQQELTEVIRKKYHTVHGKDIALGLDDILPVLAFMVRKCAKADLVTQYQLIENFMPAYARMGQLEFCYFNFRTVIESVLNP